MKDSRIYTTPLAAIAGGGLLFGIAKGFKANSGVLIALTIVGAAIGGIAGYAR
jgi:hypothetical protein